jgi:hypothetical protein
VSEPLTLRADAEIERLTRELANNHLYVEREKLRLDNERLRAALERAHSAMKGVTVFVTSREKIKCPEGNNWWNDELVSAGSSLEPKP